MKSKKLTKQQTTFLTMLDHAVQRGGRVHDYQAIHPDGWFFPIDLALGSGVVAAQLYRKGLLERRDVALFGTSYMYRKLP